MEDILFDVSLSIEGLRLDAQVDHFNAMQNVRSSFSPHEHSTYEVYFVEKGSLTVCCGTERTVLRERDIFVLSPHTVHHLECCTEDLKKFNLRFLIRQDVGSYFEKPYFVYLASEDTVSEIFQNISYIYAHILRPHDTLRLFQIRSYLGIIISHIIASILPERDEEKGENEVFQKRQNRLNQRIFINNYFSRHYSENITVQDLAEKLNYSKTHTNRLLQSCLGLTFSQKLEQTRLQVAENLLSNTLLPVSSVAEQCGYSTLRGFELFFFKHKNLLPNQYRAQFGKKK